MLVNPVTIHEGSDEFKELKKQWYAEAKEVTVNTLDAFVWSLTANYKHDYGTICHAVAAAAIAAATAVNKSPAGGITGFQAGAVMWEFIRQWNYPNNKCGMRLIDYDNFLYPQYAKSFDKVLPLHTWLDIQQEAENNIDNANQEYDQWQREMNKYRSELALFTQRHPDYEQRRKYYDHLMWGNSDEWAEYRKKVIDGFEFAPIEPHCPMVNDLVYAHWEAIAAGIIPFGYRIAAEDE
jgi:hypothetical protein